MSQPIPIPQTTSPTNTGSPIQSHTTLLGGSYDVVESPVWMSEAKWSLLERFSRITQLYRQATHAVLDSTLKYSTISSPSTWTEYEPARRYAQAYPSPPSSDTVGPLVSNSSHIQTSTLKETTVSLRKKKQDVDKRSGVWDELDEADTAVGTFQVLSNPWTPSLADIERKPLLSLKEWSSFFDKYLPEESELQQEDMESDQDSSDVDLSDGRLCLAEAEIRDRIFRGGVENSIRCHVWKYLLGIYPWSSTRSERESIRMEMRSKYQQLRSKCQFMQERIDMLEKQKRKGLALDSETEQFMDAYFRIERDVIRTDRHHPFYAVVQPVNSTHSDLSLSAEIQPGIKNLRKLEHMLQAYSIWPENENNYVQGMADLASPFLIIMDGNEAEAFFCFVHMMKMMSPNFRRDGTGMHRHLTTLSRLLRHLFPRLYTHLDTIDALNLFCTFRWMLVLFKRELDTESCCRLWEVVCAKGFSLHPESGAKEWEYVYFVVMAVFETCQEQVIRTCASFDEVLRYANDISDKLSIDLLLERAEALRLKFRHKSSLVLGDNMECVYDVLDKLESL